ncbi:MAG: TolC family outer membrane protein [Gammaproteobacteria bacterium]|nr:TolC family outer membrane protein [Gammaproteobacteria bacterium]
MYLSVEFKSLLLAFALTASASIVSAETDTPLSIFQLAEKNDAEILAAFAALKAERETKNQSVGALLPSIAFTAEAAANRENVDTTGVGLSGESTFNSHDIALTLKQPVFRKDLFTDLNITDSKILVAEAEYSAAQQDLITRVLQRFFEALAARDNLEFSVAEREAIKEQLELTRKLYKVGKTTATDFLEAQAAFDLADAQVIAAQDLVKDTLDGIKEITGVPPKQLAPLGKQFKPITPEPLDSEHWVAEAEEKNPTLIAARYQVQTSSYEVERFKSGHYPKFDVFASVSNVETGGRFGDSNIDDARIGVQLEFPIYTGGQVSSRVREAINRKEQARDELLGTLRSVVRETSKVFRNTITAMNRIKALSVAVESTETALKAIRAGYKAGTRTNADLLRAQRELYKARLDYAASKYEYAANYFQLKNITGNLGKDDVEIINVWFDN